MAHKDNSITIFHNPRCRKSRETLEIIRSGQIEPTIVEYLKEIPTKKELKSILEKLGINAFDLIRKGEAIYKEKYKGKDLSQEEWIDAMLENPKLIERPIVIKGDQAVLGRPPENVQKLIKKS